MKRDLNDVEVRVLGCLIEKERTTPDNYPLSTNALTTACNQKTSRDPIMSLSETDVDAAMLSLRERGLARSLRPSGSRAWKHRHVTTEVLPLADGELAVLAILMLRGAQTPGELRTRTDRIVGFEDVDEVESVLLSLASRHEPLAQNIGRRPGQSQDRWVQLISVDGEPSAASAATAAPTEADGDAPPQTTQPARPARAPEFRALHDSCFVMPNPWDRGSARMLEELGFPALATTSAGYAGSIGKDDQEVSRDELIRHVADLTDFVGVPLNVDSERLFPDEPGGIVETVRLLAVAGAAGCSIEDYQPSTDSIDAVDRAAEAVTIAADACAAHGIVLTARAENHLYGVADLDDTIARLQAYAAAGADVLYAPGLADASAIERLVHSVSLPVNVLHRPNGPTVDELEELGVKRISIGKAFYTAAYGTLAEQARPLLR